MLHNFTIGISMPAPSDDVSSISPLHGDVSRLSGECNGITFELISDLRNMTQVYLAKWRCANGQGSTSIAEDASWDARLQQAYCRLLSYRSAESNAVPDWLYESCRLAALIFAGSLIQGTALSDSAKNTSSNNSRSRHSATTLLSALYSAFMRTDTRQCWGNLRGVFMWVTLVGGAACWPTSRLAFVEHGKETMVAEASARKCFALFAMKAVILTPFSLAPSTICTLRTMLKLQQLTSFNRAHGGHN